MLERLSLDNLGPSPHMVLDFGKRLNLLTGDNGLGKTFVLDAAWWALTRTWCEDRTLLPDAAATTDPAIAYTVWGMAGPTEPVHATFDFEYYEWKLPRGRPPIPGLIVYARVDGGFSVWDPARNSWKSGEETARVEGSRLAAYQFNREQVWRGLWRTPKDEYEKNRDALVCRGVLEDLVTWQLDPDEQPTIDLFAQVLLELSPHEEEPLRLGSPVEMWGHAGKVPTMRVPYSEHPIPLEYASAGVKRALGLAYILVWAWTSHHRALRLARGRLTESHQIVLIFDEIEAHLHPRWQRRILPALLRAIKFHLLRQQAIPLQVIATTHAPLVLGSVETEFDESTDRLFNFQQTEEGRIEVETVPWAKFGDASGWLTSPAFDMESGYPAEAERAMNAADDLMAGYHRQPQGVPLTMEQIHAELVRTLDGADSYWPFWLPYYREHGGAA